MSVRLRLDDIQSAKKSKERSCCLQTESSSSLEDNFEAISPVLGSNTRGMEDCPDTSELFEHHNNNGRYSFPKRAMVDLEFVGVTYSVRTFSRQKLRLGGRKLSAIPAGHYYKLVVFPQVAYRKKTRLHLRRGEETDASYIVVTSSLFADTPTSSNLYINYHPIISSLVRVDNLHGSVPPERNWMSCPSRSVTSPVVFLSRPLSAALRLYVVPVICWGLRGTCRWRKSHLDMLLLTRLSGDARRAGMMIWTDGGRSHSRGSQTFKTEGDLGP
uniref:Uncharacterized protein n=1 Tax=Timema bartmani TaxID=61472 RepID=A0A7R9EYS8_9NEOP|nr:unnamed protein product [Timema bartmani]